jgi:small ligand-binding sensory domain FIST
VKAAAALVVGDVGPEEAAVRLALDVRGPVGVGDLAVAFVSDHYWATAAEFLHTLTEVLGPVPLIGCVAGSVLGNGQEVEDQAAAALWLASGLGEVETFVVEHIATASGGLFAGHRFEPGGGPYVVLADPFEFPVSDLLAHINEHVPGALLVGGLASGGGDRRASKLFLDDQVLTSGAVVASLSGAVVDLVVSQGCRPIGNPFTVTRSSGNVVHEMGGRPPFQRLQDLVAALPEADRNLLADGGLQVGQAIDEYRHEQKRGDFLVHNVVGADPATGSMVVAAPVEVGHTLQFHVRDAASADEDLRHALQDEATELGGDEPAAALLFTCTGRGLRLFSEPDHDAALVTKVLGSVPMIGAFCAGELGPVGGCNYLHSFSACLVVFR